MKSDPYRVATYDFRSSTTRPLYTRHPDPDRNVPCTRLGSICRRSRAKNNPFESAIMNQIPTVDNVASRIFIEGCSAHFGS